MATNTIVSVEVHEGRELAAKDVGGKSDPYVVITVGGKKAKTSVIKKSLNPKWSGEKHSFSLSEGEVKGAILEVTVWDKDLLTSDDFMGRVEPINVEDAALSFQEFPASCWYTLCQDEAKKHRVSGELSLSITVSMEGIENSKCGNALKKEEKLQ